MKKMVMVSVILSAISSVSFAGEVCGTLGSHTVKPECAPGQMCPMWLRLQYDLTTREGARIDLETSDMDVMANLNSLKGGDVCVAGSDQGQSFEVTSVSSN